MDHDEVFQKDLVGDGVEGHVFGFEPVGVADEPGFQIVDCDQDILQVLSDVVEENCLFVVAEIDDAAAAVFLDDLHLESGFGFLYGVIQVFFELVSDLVASCKLV